MAQGLPQQLGGKQEQQTECGGGSVTQRHFQTRTLGTRVTESGGKGKVSSEVSGRVTQKSGAVGKNGASGSEAELGVRF